MMQKRTIHSLLLTSLLLVCAFSLASAQNSVTFQNASVARCDDGALNITVNPAASISAFEVVCEITSASGGAYFSNLNVVWDAGLTSLTNRIVDLSGVDYVSPDTIRIAGMLTDASDVCLGSGPKVVARVEFTTTDVCDGTVSLHGADFACPSTPVVATTQFVDCTTTELVAATVTAGTVTVVNQNPTIDPIADATVHWGGTYLGQVTGGDPDLANGCEVLSYAKVSGPPALTVNATTGAIQWTTTGADVCTHEVEVAVVDKCGAQATTTFTICVQNDAPVITCPAEVTHIVWGETAAGTVSAIDPDLGPGALVYAMAGFDGPGAPAVDPVTGAWSWPTAEDNSYIGLFELKVMVSDGAPVCAGCSPENADTCSVFIQVIPTIAVTIEKTHMTFQGSYEDVSVYLDGSIDPPNEMGGYDFLLQYDASALTLQLASPGSLLEACGWEYFTYRYGASGNCGAGACPSGVVRVVAIAEMNNGANYADCFASTTDTELFKLTFLVTNDRTYECTQIPVQFIWYDCGDNAIASKTGDTLFISRHVYDYPFDTIIGPIAIEDPDAAFPTNFGAPAVCETSGGPNKPEPLRLIDFMNGGIDIACADSIDDRGDLNLDGQANTIADAVLFSNYFVYGLSVFTINVEGQIAASDVNADGLPLSVADLVYMIRVVVGDALPYAKVVTPVAVNLVDHQGRLAVQGESIGAAFLTVAGNVTPQLLAPQMELKYAYDALEDVTRVLIWSQVGNSFDGEFVAVTGTVTHIEMATAIGQPVTLTKLPTSYALLQNYPNPFNPTTTISFALPEASDYTLTIYNVQGQVVQVKQGSAAAGTVDVVWDAAGAASGIYFYRLEAGNFTATKKMVLLK
ncbi:MAG TPA: T9SS type A sorting domain-containing protein [candidate division Zixibacteria bacterium]|nr:T9SS type A sorting domain-containing protein [candidate division Zixibacteria bacterium]